MINALLKFLVICFMCIALLSVILASLYIFEDISLKDFIAVFTPKRRKQKKRWKENWDKYNNGVLLRYKEARIKSEDCPRLSFERFLTFYAIQPEKWHINTNKYNDEYYFPVYENHDEIIFIYWDTPEDLRKYREWLDKVYNEGESALNAQERDRQMKKLAECMEKDLRAKREQTEKELAVIEEQFKKERAASTNKPIELTLDFPPPRRQNEHKINYDGMTLTYCGDKIPSLRKAPEDARVGDIFYLKGSGHYYYRVEDGWKGATKMDFEANQLKWKKFEVLGGI